MAVTERAVRSLSRYQHSWLALFEGDDLGQVRILGASKEIESTVLEQVPTFPAAGDAMLDEIRTAGRVVVVLDAPLDPRTNKAIVAKVHNRTIINVPMRLGERVLGALGIGTFGDEGVLAPTELELDALLIFAMQLAAAVDRVRGEAERQRVERERHRLQRQLEVLQRVELMAVLASGVAHDLNNFLSVILGNLQSLDPEALDADRDALRDALEAAVRSKDVVRQLLLLGKTQAPRREDVDLQARLAATVQLVRAATPRGVVVEQEAGPHLHVPGDPVQLDQAFANLLINARDAVGDFGVITVGLDDVRLDEHFVATSGWARPGHFARVRVRDTGPGIPPELMERIYDPLFTTKPQGTGLGLAVVTRVVQQHRGLLHCRTAVGQGTTFEVYLPAA